MNLSLFSYRLKSSAAGSLVKAPSKILGALVALSALFASPDAYAMKRKAEILKEEKGKEKETEKGAEEPETKKQRPETPSHQSPLTEEELRDLEERANQGDLDAHHKLARYYLSNGDKLKALTYFSMAAEQGCQKARRIIAIESMRGENLKKDMQKAFSLLTKAADQGDAIAQFQLAQLYLRDEVTETNVGKAVDLLSKSVAQGYSPALLMLAHFHMKGIGVELNPGVAFKMYVFAAAQGEVAAQEELGLEPFTITKDVTHPKEVMERLIKSAESGEKKSQYFLGKAYQYGLLEVEKDENKALELFQKSATQGYPPANYRLFRLDEKLTDHLYKAADGGHAPAQYDWATVIAKQQTSNLATPQRGIPTRSKSVLDYLNLAANQGHTLARIYVGARITGTPNLPSEYDTAFHHLLDNKDHPDAQNGIKRMMTVTLGAPTEDGPFQDLLSGVTARLNELQAEHDMQCTLTHKNSGFQAAELAMPGVHKQYKIITDFETQLISDLEILKTVSPGFLTTKITPPFQFHQKLGYYGDPVEVTSQYQHFKISNHSDGRTRLYTYGSRNVRIANTMMKYFAPGWAPTEVINAFDKLIHDEASVRNKFREDLLKIKFTLKHLEIKLGHATISEEETKQTSVKFEKTKEKFLAKKVEFKEIKRQSRPFLEKLKNEKEEFLETIHQFKEVVMGERGLARRNREALEEFSFLQN